MNALPAQRFGLSCALATPLGASGAVDVERLAAHARNRLAAGCSSVTAFGTTGEGPSFGMATRTRVLGALRAAGIDMAREVVVGIATPATDEAIEQARQAEAFGCRIVLLAPPFYFKDPGSEGLVRWFGTVLDALRRHSQRAILYHIPSVTQVPLSLDLIARLKSDFPGTVSGVKDSSGDWQNACALLEHHRDLAILIGDERRLAEAVRMGASGAISGLANFAAEALLPLAGRGEDDRRISQLVDEVLKYPVVPAVKALIAHVAGDATWRAVAPPLEPLPDADRARLTAAFDAIMTAVPA